MNTPNLSGKTCLITGGTSGIGLESAVDIAAMGAHVIVTGRDAAKGERVLAEIRQRSGSTKVDLMLCDFESQKSIRRLAAEFLAKYPALHILVNNAGTVYATRELTEDGIEKTFATNHLGPYLLTTLLLDRIVASAPARIVNVSSVGHMRGTMDFDDLGFEKNYFIMRGYERSKLGNVLFTNELARKLAGKNVTVNSLHPGPVATNIWSYSPWYIRPFFAIFGRFIFISAKEGSKTTTFLATSPEVEGVTGKYFVKSKATPSSALSMDEAVAKKLWDVSAKMTDVV